jgi:hypothetical protein
MVVCHVKRRLLLPDERIGDVTPVASVNSHEFDGNSSFNSIARSCDAIVRGFLSPDGGDPDGRGAVFERAGWRRQGWEGLDAVGAFVIAGIEVTGRMPVRGCWLTVGVERAGSCGDGVCGEGFADERAFAVGAGGAAGERAEGDGADGR